MFSSEFLAHFVEYFAEIFCWVFDLLNLILWNFFTKFIVKKNKICFFKCLLNFDRAEETDASEIWSLIDWFDVLNTSNWLMRVWDESWLISKNKLTEEEKLIRKDMLIRIWSDMSENCFSSYWISTVMKIWQIVRFMTLYTVIKFHT